MSLEEYPLLTALEGNQYPLATIRIMYINIQTHHVHNSTCEGAVTARPPWGIACYMLPQLYSNAGRRMRRGGRLSGRSSFAAGHVSHMYNFVLALLPYMPVSCLTNNMNNNYRDF
jgi:hypothetical protein